MLKPLPKDVWLNPYLKWLDNSAGTGIGSIIFRDEEILLDGREDPIGFYNKNIIPYKSELEIWFVENNSLWLYIKTIFVTAWVVIFPASKIADRVFNGIPRLPESLKI